MPTIRLEIKLKKQILFFMFITYVLIVYGVRVYGQNQKSAEPSPLPMPVITNPLLICESKYNDLTAEISINKNKMVLKIQTLENKNYQCSASIKWYDRKNAKIPFYNAESEYIEKCEPPLPKPLDRLIRNKIMFQLNSLNQNSDLIWIRYEQPKPCQIKLNHLRK